jgi:hypothetical protein
MKFETIRERIGREMISGALVEVDVIAVRPK